MGASVPLLNRKMRVHMATLVLSPGYPLPSVLGWASWRACSPKTPQEQETPTGKVHGIGSGLGFMLLLLTPLWAQGMPELAAVTTWNAAGFSIALFALILFLISGKRSGRHRGLTGLWQRLCLAALYGVLLITGLASWVVS